MTDDRRFELPDARMPIATMGTRATQRSRRPIRRRAATAVAAVALAATAMPIAAAPPAAASGTAVYADPAGLCAGLTPCFTTLQGAVDNAAPAPATVGLFPGTYAESVDLDAMGSAAGGGPGDLTLQALDASGMPATTGVLIDPGALGGPGAGFGLAAGQTVPFAGGIALLGLAVTSPDTVGVAILDALGDVEIRDLLVENCGTAGAVAFTAGALIATDVVAFLNQGNGLILMGSEATVEDVIALRNDGSGLGVIGDGLVTVRRVQADGNGDLGLGAGSCTRLEVEDVTADDNDEGGVQLGVGPSQCVFARGGAGLLSPLERPGFDALLDDPPAVARRSAEGGVVPVVATASGLSAGINGGFGVGVILSDGGTFVGGAALENVVADGNGGFGLAVGAETLQLAGASLTGNLSGLVLLVGSASVAQVTASDNTAAVITPPREGVGVYIGAPSSSEFVDLVAERNAFAGLALDSASELLPAAGPYRIAGGRFADNPFGIAAVGDGLVDVAIDGAEAADNAIVGIALPNLRHGTILGATATGNPTGISANVTAALEVRESEIAANQEGVTLVVQAGAAARVHCSNLRGNLPGAGLHLAGGDAADARANFWGDPSGPTHPGNPGGLGDLVRDGANGGAGAVDYSGFLAAEATPGDCIDPIALEIPAAGGAGLALLATLLALAGLAALRRRAAAADSASRRREDPR